MDFVQKKELILSQIAPLKHWEDRYKYIINSAKIIPSWSSIERDDQFLVPGCLSKIWLRGEVITTQNSQVLNLYCDADSLIMKGLVSLITGLYSGETLDTIQANSSQGPRLLEELGISQHLTPNRRNGLNKVMSIILSYGT